MKSSPTPIRNIFKRARGVMQIMTANKKPKRKIFLRILKDLQKNPSISFSVCCLMILFEYAPSIERRMDIYQMIAKKMSSCEFEEEQDAMLVDYIIVHCSNHVVLAMCHALRYQWGLTTILDEEGIPGQFEILEEYQLDHHFKMNVKKAQMLKKIS